MLPFESSSEHPLAAPPAPATTTIPHPFNYGMAASQHQYLCHNGGRILTVAPNPAAFSWSKMRSSRSRSMRSSVRSPNTLRATSGTSDPSGGHSFSSTLVMPPEIFDTCGGALACGCHQTHAQLRGAVQSAVIRPAPAACHPAYCVLWSLMECAAHHSGMVEQKSS